ncbi:cytochrome c3 family protein [Desulfobotulus mexicanus]|uniref:Cytochrome c3 family protein n=1 Tax=Desulfobotulus mexicanus TaxID=2586642 RepID=A0A5S5MES3_9BACT|nr:cytochrome c3 family protein [Desulfobotulus mexicanus]TYT74178.1 cytochrome c3 family protein [Desulfobotulus mexicanus]
MKKKKGFFLAVTGAALLLFAAAVALAGAIKTEVDDVIQMKTPIYEEHERPLVTFTHKLHSEDYGISCGTCHHDDKGQPLELVMGDPVQSCAACHSIPGQRPRGDKTPKLDFHAEAMHDSCRSCHAQFNREKGERIAPIMCNQCHTN